MEQSLNNIYTDVAELQEQMADVQSAITELQTATSDTGWVDLTLNSGWSMNDYPNEVPQYRKIGKIVMLRGLVNATAAADRTIATLPEGFRPSAGWYNRFNCVLNQSEYANVQITGNGAIMDYTKTVGTTSRSYLSLNGITFITN